MKYTLSSLLILGFSFSIYAQNTQEHHHEEHESKAVSINKLLDGFDMNAAITEMNEKGIPQADRHGYLRYLKAKYVKDKYPAFNFNELINNPYKDYIPENKSGKSIYCTNADFEEYNFTNWFGGLSTYDTPFSNTTIQSNGYNASIFDVSARHTIMTTPAINNNPALGAIIGYDELALNPSTGLADIPFIPSNGGTASCRLGNANTGAEIERLYYDMNVTANNTTFYYQFAIVLQDPLHATYEQPYFKITVKDGNGNQIGGVCGVYNVNATLASSDASFVQITYQSEALYYRPWELVSVDLTAFIGTTVRIEFETADCSLGGHFGYAYIDAGCGMLDMAASFCTTDDSALLVAPAGFNSYQWYGPNNSSLLMNGETDDSLFIANPIINDIYYVTLESASGCVSNLQSQLQYTTVTTGLVTINNSCQGGASGSATVVGQGSTSGYTYLWTPGNYTTSSVTGLAPGTYNVHIEANDPNCGAVDTLITIGTNPPVPFNLNSNFCSGGNSIAVAPSGSNYQWYNPSQQAIAGATNDSLTVTSPFDGQNYYVSYISSQGCSDTAVVTMNQTFLNGFFSVNVGNCGQATINYIGSTSPSWNYGITGPSYTNNINNTTQTSVSLTGLLPGSYTATVTDAGCTSSSSFDIIYTVTNTPQNVTLCPLGTQTITSPTAGTHVWTDPNGTETTTTGTVYTVPTTPPLNGTYIDSVTLSTGCLTINTFNVTVTPTNNLPVTSLDPCPLDDVAISSSTGGTHYWIDPSGNLFSTTTSTSFTINDILPGTYIDSTVTSQGCIVIAAYDVNYNSIVTSVNSSNVLCYADSNATASITILSGPSSGVYTYDWTGTLSYTGNGSSQNDLYAGIFIVETTNGNCEKTDTIIITSPPMPQDTLIITTEFCEVDPYAIMYAPEGFSNYQWYLNGQAVAGEDNDSIVIADVSLYANYYVTYEVPPHNCIRRTTFISRTNTGARFIPNLYNNVFTPNSDSENEIYYPFNSLFLLPADIDFYTSEFHIQIYNRWGELMFESDDYMNAWKGKNNNGNDCAEGVYYWMITYVPKCEESPEPIEINGTVHLMR
jgi:gliding motility-associated-like protein